MFVHQSKLDHLLQPADYFSREAFDRERHLLFLRHWQIAGLAHQIGRFGDYLACSVHGIPVIVHNDNGSIVAFKNVCAHRHAMLQPNGSGRQKQLTCQYHGWQYQGDGRVSKVPDGESFKGIQADEFCLTRVKAEVCGPFVWVCLDPLADSFRSHLGGFSDEFDAAFGVHRHFGTWQTDHAAAETDSARRHGTLAEGPGRADREPAFRNSQPP